MHQNPFKKYRFSSQASRKNQKLFSYSYHSPGSIQGTLRIPPKVSQPRITLIDYDDNHYLKIDDIALEKCHPYLQTDSVSWIDIGGVSDANTFQAIGETFRLHPLILEDVANVPQRPKIEEQPDQLLIITQMVMLKPNHPGFWLEQVSLVLSAHYLLTVQEESEADCFGRIRDRLSLNQGLMRRQGADFLAYALWDAVIDGFFPVLETLGDRLEDLEDKVVVAPTPATLTEIHQIKRELLALRRAIWPQRDALNTLIRDGHPLVREDVKRYLRDCYDHTVMIIDVIETYRELASGLMDVYLSAVSNRMNEVMQLLTVISTIFIPLTFIAGIYGMNFNTEKSPWNMPELNWPLGYLFCLGIMGAIASYLLLFFRRKGWLKISNFH
ncbi:magnesium/cobalt transporter CorA [Synechococcus moorigangaii CMS01]|nr:magnesium/cobalt transporter CorA [Synechococcus moorigangaii CMS01]